MKASPRSLRGSQGSWNQKEIKSSFYQERTKKNVVDSEATIVFCYGKASGGSELTLEYARQCKKPVLEIDLEKNGGHAEKINTWLGQRVAARLLADTEKDWTPPMKITLNVAGSRESEAPGIHEKVRKIMEEVLHVFQCAKAKV